MAMSSDDVEDPNVIDTKRDIGVELVIGVGTGLLSGFGLRYLSDSLLTGVGVGLLVGVVTLCVAIKVCGGKDGVPYPFDYTDLFLGVAMTTAAVVGLALILVGVLGTSFFGVSAFDHWPLPTGLALLGVAGALIWAGGVRLRKRMRQ